jgi:hypothetical protein
MKRTDNTTIMDFVVIMPGIAVGLYLYTRISYLFIYQTAMYNFVRLSMLMFPVTIFFCLSRFLHKHNTIATNNVFDDVSMSSCMSVIVVFSIYFPARVFGLSRQGGESIGIAIPDLFPQVFRETLTCIACSIVSLLLNKFFSAHLTIKCDLFGIIGLIISLYWTVLGFIILFE